VNIGPVKSYEQDSEVIYQLTVTSIKNLSKFVVSTSSDAFDLTSKVLKTVPENVIDSEGNFIRKIKDVVIFYSFRIHASVPPKSAETVTFTLLDENNNAGSVSKSHVVIKKGSTSGSPVREIDMSYFNKQNGVGIGSQDNVFYELENGLNPDRGWNQNRGPFFSLKYGVDLQFGVDAINIAEDIDIIGYKLNGNTLNASFISPLVNNGFYLVSPGDSMLLYTAFPGAIPYRVQVYGNPATQNGTGEDGEWELTYGGITRRMVFITNQNNSVTQFVNTYKADYTAQGLDLSITDGNRLIFRVIQPLAGYEEPQWRSISGRMDAALQTNRDYLKTNALRKTMIEFYQKLRDANKPLKVVKFLRLDNIDAPTQVTPEYFDALTHDNEFDLLLSEVETKGDIRTAALALNQVWGFVTSDGKRGMIRTSPAEIIDVNGNIASVPAPNSGAFVLYGTIKYQIR
jgi:hypothetical protein